MAVAISQTGSRALGASAMIVLTTTSLGVLIAQIDTSVVNLAVKHIGADFHTGVSELQWILDAYNLAYASLLLTAGTLADLHGRRRIFVLGIALFTLGSLACGLAPNTETLLAGRVIAGIGAALEVPTSLAILTVAFPDTKVRNWALGVWASCNGLAFIIGPTLGGVLVDVAGWRSVFLLIIPVSALALCLATTSISESRDPTGRRLDLPGQGLAIVALGTLALAAIEGPRWGGASWPSIASITIAIASTFFFLRRQSGEGAIVPLPLLKNRVFSACLVIAGCMTFGIYAMLFLVPLYLQSGLGNNALDSGLALLPMSIAFVIVSQWSGKIVNQFGPRVPMTAGMTLMGTGLLMLALVPIQNSLGLIESALLIIGCGLGLNTGPVNSVAVANVPRARAGTASGLINTSRMVGATLGVAVLGALFAVFSRSKSGIAVGLPPAFIVGAAAELLGAA
ncbi:MAG: MFS transporter, partial [Bradyrhizobiaceae bacterium]|nr:MFS transporter [Bradyrhizobiaceae bacterium]